MVQTRGITHPKPGDVFKDADWGCSGASLVTAADEGGDSTAEPSDLSETGSVFSDDEQETSSSSEFVEMDEDDEEEEKQRCGRRGRKSGRTTVVVNGRPPPRKLAKDEDTYIPAAWLLSIKRRKYQKDALHKPLPEWVKMNRLRRLAKLKERRRSREEWLREHRTHYSNRREAAATRTRVGGRFSRDTPEFIPISQLLREARVKRVGAERAAKMEAEEAKEREAAEAEAAKAVKMEEVQ